MSVYASANTWTFNWCRRKGSMSLQRLLQRLCFRGRQEYIRREVRISVVRNAANTRTFNSHHRKGVDVTSKTLLPSGDFNNAPNFNSRLGEESTSPQPFRRRQKCTNKEESMSWGLVFLGSLHCRWRNTITQPLYRANWPFFTNCWKWERNSNKKTNSSCF